MDWFIAPWAEEVLKLPGGPKCCVGMLMLAGFLHSARGPQVCAPFHSMHPYRYSPQEAMLTTTVLGPPSRAQLQRYDAMLTVLYMSCRWVYPWVFYWALGEFCDPETWFSLPRWFLLCMVRASVASRQSAGHYPILESGPGRYPVRDALTGSTKPSDMAEATEHKMFDKDRAIPSQLYGRVLVALCDAGRRLLSRAGRARVVGDHLLNCWIVFLFVTGLVWRNYYDTGLFNLCNPDYHSRVRRSPHPQLLFEKPC